jgi:predicted PurR-regulated permease PerM
VFKKIGTQQNRDTLIICTLVLVVVWLLTQISGSVWPLIASFLGNIAPLILGLIFAFMLNPFVKDITKRFFNGNKLIGIGITCLILIIALIYIIYPILRDLVLQSSDIIAYLSRETQMLLNSVSSLNDGFKGQIMDYLTGFTGNVTQTILGSLNNVASGMVQTFLTLIVTIFTLVEYDTIVEKITLLYPKNKRAKVVQYIDGLEQQLYFYLRSLVVGVVLLSLVFGVILHFLSIHNSWSFAIIMSLLTALIPVIGPLIATGILAVITIPVGTTAAIIGFVVLFIFMQVFINYISPKIFARSLHLSNLLIIAAFMIGFALLGIPGALFAIPSLIVILYTYDFLNHRYHWSEKK